MSNKATHQITHTSTHNSRAAVQAKRSAHRRDRGSWRQRARAIILEIADGDFGRAQAQYEGYTT